MPGRDVYVTIRSRQTDAEGIIRTSASAAPGTLHNRSGKAYLFFQETQADGSVTRTSVKYDESRVQITRSGPISARLLFEENQHFRSSCLVPYGSILIDIDTERYTLKESGEGALLTIEYRMALENGPSSHCKVEVDIEDNSRMKEA